MAHTYNTLVISDLHLGEDLSPSATVANRLHLDLVERQLCAFLRHYGRRRDGGRPWRLVVNGDMVDFLSISIRPGDADYPTDSPAARRADRDEREFGLRRSPEVAAIGIARVGKRHREVFRSLARFVARGNRLEIVAGNHDAELGSPEAQRAFTDVIVAAYGELPEAARTGSAEELGSRIGFHAWFFHEPGALWIEHGHQYDACCSFENQLDPREPSSGAIVMNVDVAGCRYLTNYVREATPHEQDGWSAIGYLRLGFGMGLRGCLQIFRGYHLFCVRLIEMWRRTRDSRRQVADIRARHLTRRRELADATGIDPDILGRIDDLRHAPVVGDFAKLAPVVMIDRLLAFAAVALFGLAGFLALGLPWGGVLAAVLMVAAHFVIKKTGGSRNTDASHELAAASEQIARTIDVKYVVMGHSHEPVMRPIGGGASYVNLGTWVPAGHPGILRAFTHLVVRHTASGPVGSLCQWRDGQSRAFTPGWRASPATHQPASPATVRLPASVRLPTAAAPEPETIAARAG
jgi:UDP-2,3-diacylglucosamine pyrophosphatase LpxH